MKKKSHTLPVSPYVHKWLVHSHGYREALEVCAPISAISPSNAMVVHRHFAEPRPGYVAINIFGYYPNRRKLYNLHQSLEAWFFNAMLTHVQIAVQLGHPAKTALSAFLARNRISEGELSIHTAYKRWQRLGRAGLPGIKAI